MNRAVVVRIECSHEPLLVGSEAAIVSLDFIEGCGASERNPLIDMTVVGTGYRTFGRLADVKYLRMENTHGHENH